MDLIIQKINSSKLKDLNELANEAESEGFRFVSKTIHEWIDKTNDFSKNGEFLLGAYANGKCIAIGGLNSDPYIHNPDIGRVRHLYVSKSFRRMGVATQIVKKIINGAEDNFKTLRLFTSNSEASVFYTKMGFSQSNRHKESHVRACRKTIENINNNKNHE